jgi:uncharacterized protein YcfL
MRRFALLAALASVLLAPVVSAQTQAPASPAKYIAPVKGVATIEVIQMQPKQVGKDMVHVIKVRNTSKGTINLLKADEYWYDKSMKIVTNCQYAHKKAPIQPGEIVEITLRSPIPPGAVPNQNQIMFRHANGEVKATKVKAFK